MSLFLINLQSNQQISLDKENPLIIGRNNVLGCFDKKVSRSHGRITCTENGGINLVALHSNPCFFMKKGVPPVRQLNKDEEENLSEGDCLGLLPNLYWFQISSSSEKVKKEPEEANSESCQNSETAVLKNVNENKANANETQNVNFSTIASSDYSKRIGSPEFEKTRRLPLSAYDTDEIKESDKSSTARDNYTNIKKLKLNNTDDCDIPQFDIKNNGIKKEENKDGEPSTSKSFIDETLDNSNEAKEVTSTEGGKEAKPDKPIKRPLCQYEHNCFRKNPQHKIEFCHPSDSDYVAYEDRPICRYGLSCRRTNRAHVVEFRHVRARSRNSSDTPTGEERPPCFSGSRCFNQDPQHRKYFYHPPKGYDCRFVLEDSSSCSSEDFECFSDFEIYEDFLAKEYDSDFASSPLPPKRRRKQVKRSPDHEDVDDDEDEDEYDVEDPFANDASSDEYVPSDSNSEG